jgi:hypothetical protein
MEENFCAGNLRVISQEGEVMLMRDEEMFIEDEMIFNPTPEQEKKKDYYLARARCKNCRYPKIKMGYAYMNVLIQKGRLIPTGKYTCSYCGCKELRIY